MKILVIFADMIGGDYLNLGNVNSSQTELDSYLNILGGTFYSKCYTPAPDTPRSSACMWTGLYPKRNGCDNRLKYPKRFLKTGFDFWHILKDAGYTFHVYMRETDVRIGTLPDGFESYAKPGTLDEYLNQWRIEDNSLSFFYFHDLHSFLDNNGYTPRQLKKGVRFLTSLIRKIFDQKMPDEFDYILLFSDHGFRYEGRKMKHLIDDDRVKTTMFLRKKGDTSLVIDEDLRSNLDVCPTILDIAGIDNFTETDGKSLLGEGHKYVFIEDHDDFSVRLSQSIEHWAVFTANNKYWLECSGKWDMDRKDDVFDRDYFKKAIIDKMNDFDTNSKLWDAMHIYDDNKIADNRYSDGSIQKKPFYRGRAILGTKIIVNKILGLYK